MIKIFDVLCEDCKKKSEVMFFKGKAKCPQCESENLTKQPTTSHFVTETSPSR